MPEIKQLIAIDPGKTGAIAYRLFGEDAQVIKMPGTLTDVWAALKKSKGEELPCNVRGMIEDVHGSPDMGVTSAFTFGYSSGSLRMGLVALEVPHKTMSPQKWQPAIIGAPNHPKIPKEMPEKEKKRIRAKRRQVRKNRIKEVVQALYPHLRVTLATADALAMLHYLEKEYWHPAPSVAEPSPGAATSAASEA